LKEQLTRHEAELLPRFAEHYRQLKGLRRRVRRGLQRQWMRSVAGLALLPLTGVLAPSPVAKSNSYENPLPAVIPGDGVVESCADPSLIRGQTPGDPYWYAYCTTDPLNDEDRNARGQFNFHFIPILRSLDLFNWTYVGDAFASRPAWIADGPWAPNIKFFNGLYYLYYTAPDTILNPRRDSAIGVATSPSPIGPFVDRGVPVVAPRPARCCLGEWYRTLDPDVIEAGGQKYIFFGANLGGIWARKLTPDGLHSDPASETQITIAQRYEGPRVIYKDGYYYLFVSAADCCRGPLSGYSVLVGRSQNVLGLYVDREGVSLLASQVGGTPFLSMNGNAFVGPGHNSLIQDFDGQWWTFYHAVNRFDPYFAGQIDFTKRPLMLDPIDWIGSWPTVRGGYGVSDDPQHGPAAQPGDKTNYRTPKFQGVRLGKVIPALSDEFNLPTFTAPWTWVRPPVPGTYALTGTTFRWDTQAADLFEDSNNASVLTEPMPRGDYAVETRVHLNLPPEGCCFNYVQAGSVVYANDDNFIRLAHVSIQETRQTAFAKEWSPAPAGYPRYGNTVVGPPSHWTSLRIVRCKRHGEETYTPYTSRDGTTWVRGGTWAHRIRDAAKIGLVALGGSGFTANFDYVRVYRVLGCSYPVDSPSGNDGG
jgi:arabinan endo-1,5-alpha-L-arabinosidase